MTESKERVERFMGLALDAKGRIENGFREALDDANEMPGRLQHIIDGMWSSGWNPQGRNINLFVTDFGLVLVAALREIHGGQLIFRSDSDLSHLSMWWPERNLEIFPFQYVLKCLLHRDGNSIISFIRGVGKILA